MKILPYGLAWFCVFSACALIIYMYICTLLRNDVGGLIDKILKFEFRTRYSWTEDSWLIWAKRESFSGRVNGGRKLKSESWKSNGW